VHTPGARTHQEQVPGLLAVEVRAVCGPAADALVMRLLVTLPALWDAARGAQGSAKRGEELLARVLRLVPWKAGAYSWAALGAGLGAPPTGWRVHLDNGSMSFRLLMPLGPYDWCEWCPARDFWLWGVLDALWPSLVACLGRAAVPAFVRAAARLGYSTHDAAGCLFLGERAESLLLPEGLWVPRPSLVGALRELQAAGKLPPGGFPLSALLSDLREAARLGETLSTEAKALLARATAASSRGGAIGGPIGGAVVSARRVRLLAAAKAAADGGPPQSKADAEEAERVREALARGGSTATANKAAGGGGGKWQPLEGAGLTYLVARVAAETGCVPRHVSTAKAGEAGEARFAAEWEPLCEGVRALATPDLLDPRPPSGADRRARVTGDPPVIRHLEKQAAAGSDAMRAAGRLLAAEVAAGPLAAALADPGKAAAAAAAVAACIAAMEKNRKQTAGSQARSGETRAAAAAGAAALSAGAGAEKVGRKREREQ